MKKRLAFYEILWYNKCSTKKEAVMAELKQIVARNLSQLRKEHQLTQIQLAEQIHYSDKAVSKWERGESLPDLVVLKQLADYYHVTLDALVCEDGPHTLPEKADENQPRVNEDTSALKPYTTRNRIVIAGMAIVLVWLIATTIFVILDILVPTLQYSPFMFVYAIPLTMIIWLVFNSIWFNRRANYFIISLLVWTTLGTLFVTFWSYRPWQLFIIGIPAQIIILLWSALRAGKRNIKKEASSVEK